MREYGIGIWGAGWVAGAHLEAYLAQPECRIAAIGSRRLESAQALAERHGLTCPCFTDYEAFLAQPGLDIVSICTPHHLHPRNCILAARAGKHVYVEKPIAVTLDGLYAMRDAVREAGVRTIVGFVPRWTPLVARLHEIVRGGALGDLVLVDADYWHSRVRPENYRRRATGGSALLLGGCHAIDAVRYITGLDPIEVFAHSAQVRTSPDEPYEFDCAEACLVRYSNGAVGRVSAVVKGHVPYQFNIDLIGDRGAVRNNRVSLHEESKEHVFRTLPEPDLSSGDVQHHPFAGLIRHFLDCIEADHDSDVNVERAVLTHEVCFAALLSERSGQPVALPLGQAEQVAIHELLRCATPG